MTNILILGGGFGGLITAEHLVKTFGSNSKHRITVVAPHDKFTFYPALVRLAFGDCTADDITFDLRDKLNELNVRFVQGEVIKLNTNLKRVKVTGDDFDGEILYDYLVIAMGRRLATEKTPGFFEHAQHLLGINAALEFGETVRKFEKGKIVVGLAPDGFLPIPVCETAFALARKFQKEIESDKISINVVFPASIKTAFGGADLEKKLGKAFAKHNITVTTDFAVKEINKKAIVSDDQRSMEYDLLMLVPPFRGQTMLGNYSFTDESAFILVDNFMRVQDLDNTYAVGDITAFPGPKLAFMAIRQAQVAAENLVGEMRGGMPSKIYHHDLAIIIDEGGENSIFLNYGIWDKSLYGLKVGKMWSRMKNQSNQLWSVVRDG